MDLMEAKALLARVDRGRGLGGTDARRIMAGDWLPLYEEKVGLRAPDDLSGVFRVQLGIRTEAFHAEWFGKMTGFALDDPQPTYEHPEHRFMYAHLDKWLPEFGSFVELKHSSANARFDDKARYYMAQLQHYMAVTGADHCWLSVIRGNDDPVWGKVDRKDAYIDTLIETERAFWWHVENKVPPDIVPQAALERIAKNAELIPVNGWVKRDMTGSNAWAVHAETFLRSRDAARLHDEAKKKLHELVANDAGEAYGFGVVARRDVRGRISIRAAKEDKE